MNEEGKARRRNRLISKLPRGMRRLFLFLTSCLVLLTVFWLVHLDGLAVTVRNDSDSVLTDVSVSQWKANREIADLPPHTWARVWIGSPRSGTLKVQFTEPGGEERAVFLYVSPEDAQAEFILWPPNADYVQTERVGDFSPHWRKREYLTPQPVDGEVYKRNHRCKSNNSSAGSAQREPNGDADTGEEEAQQ